jgi:hydroxymethylglutaryl-CoA lyase
MFEKLPERVSLYEVGPRDGLQNEARAVPVEDRVRLVRALAAAGLKRIEVGSFVRPDRIPQLAGTEAVVRALGIAEGLTFSALVPNLEGLERALGCGIREVAVFMSVSETHNKKNVNRATAESLRDFAELTPRALGAGLRVRAYLSTVWGCPYEGDVDPRRAVQIAKELHALGVYELSLGDTIGIGTPLQTRRLLELMLAEIPVGTLAMHMHDTRGTALANCLVGLEMGITTFDASVGGMGGCPYAPGAAGNMATEDAAFAFSKMGVETGVDLEKLVEAGALAQELVKRKLDGRYLQAALGERRRR